MRGKLVQHHLVYNASFFVSIIIFIPSFSKKSAEDASEKGNTNYMDLKEIHEQPSYATLSERESYYENYQEGPFYENTFT